MSGGGYSNELSVALRAVFPNLTIARLEKLWAYVCDMPRGVVRTDLADIDLVNPDDLVICLHLAVEKNFRDRDNYQRLVRNLTAGSKRRCYPKSYLRAGNDS